MSIPFFHIALVGLGGMVGSVLRFITGSYITQKMPSNFPWGTLCVNVLGSFIFGLIAGQLVKQPAFHPWHLLLAAGFCGGFTTFSAFSFESLALFRSGQFGLLLIYIFASLLLGIFVTAWGYSLSK